MQEKTRTTKDLLEIDFNDLLGLLLANAFSILLTTFLSGILTFVISAFVITPKYESTTSIYILNKDTGTTITLSDTQLASQLTKDYEELIKGRTVLEQVMDKFELSDESYEDFSKRISVENASDTHIISITVSDEKPRQAQAIANELRLVAAEHIQSVTDVQAVNVADVANLPTKQAEPSIIIWTIVGLLLGMLISSTFAIIRFLIDDTIKTSEDVTQYLQLSTLALIPLEED